MSRAEAIQALYQLSGILVRVDACSYPDVPEEYQDAVAWADSVGVSGGISEGRFAPFIPVTRGQLAAMLHRFAAWRGEDRASRLALSWDDEEVSSYAEEALNWVLDQGLYEGMTCWGAYPQLPVSRLQLAGILARLQKDRALWPRRSRCSQASQSAAPGKIMKSLPRSFKLPPAVMARWEFRWLLLRRAA